MALQDQVIPITLGNGVDTKTDAKQTLPSKLSVLENGVFTKGARLSKRNGYTAQGTTIVGGGSLSSPQALTEFTPAPGIEELVQIANNTLYSYSDDQNQWISKDACYSVGLKYKGIYSNLQTSINGDAALNSGIEVYVWSVFDGATTVAACSVIDQTTGAQITLNENLSTIIGRVRCAAIGDYIYIFYNNASNDICWRRVDVTSPGTISAETVLATDAHGSIGAIDLVVADGFLWFAYYTTTPDIEIIKVSSAGAIVDNVTLNSTLDENIFTLCVSTNLFIYWHEPANGLSYAVYDSSLTSVLAATVIDADVTDLFNPGTAVAISATSQYIFYTRGPNPVPYTSLASSQQNLYRATVSTTSVTVAAAIICRSVRPATKAFTVNSVQYLWCCHISDLQATLFLFRYDGLCIGKSYYGQTRGVGAYSLPSVVSKSSTEFFHPQAVITQYSGSLDSFSGIKSGLFSIAYDFDSDDKFQTRMLGQNLHITGGYLSMYDGRTVVESGFHFFPEGTTNSTATTGGNIADGTYQYAIIYKWVDNMGQVHRSAPSIPLTVIVSAGTGTAENTLTIPTLRVTEKKGVSGEVAIEVYRTEAGGTIFYNLRTPADAITFNDTAANSVSFVDEEADASITSNELLYTTGGVLENIPPESCTLIDVYQSRAVVAGMQDPLQYGYSKVQVKGEGVAFSDVFVSRLDPLGGAITAVRLMDDKIILYKPDHIFFVSGDGPNDTGTQNNYSLPQLITSDSGCPYPKSTVLMPLGMMYKSKKGIYLLTRGLQVEYVGADVQDYNSQDVVSATLLQDKNQVIFLTSSGSTLVYDYYFRQWSTFTNHTGIDAVNWLDKYCYLRSNNQVYEQSALFTDNGTEIRLKAATAWLKMAGIQGFQRVRKIGFLGEYKSAHSLQIRAAYDYNDTYSNTYTFDATTVIASSANPYEFRVGLARQKCAALKIEIQDIPNAITPAESYNMTDLSLEVGVKPGINRLKAGQSI